MNILYLTHPINGIVMVGLAVGLGKWLTHKFNLPWRLWWIGAATFVLSQLGHIPFNQGLTVLFKQGLLPSPPAGFRLIFNAIVLGLSAGLWEEMARFATYRWWAKEARTTRKGLLLGAGHGGIEAIILGALVLYTFIQMIAMQGADLKNLVPANQIELAQSQIAAYWSSPWYLPLLGAVERLFSLVVHLALSLLVMQVFTRGKGYWLWLAILWHALPDAFSVYAVQTWGLVATEVILGGLTILNLGIIWALWEPEPVVSELGQPAVPLPDPSRILSLPEIEITPDTLEKTRFQ